uniref:F-box/LRR-repeat protein 15/At3g58940/PEG3-like LRR domain-containing protein n=1 Tax=Leersia perrieri TaxID=77586 RepID=A0A0D9X663_9ORYZ
MEQGVESFDLKLHQQDLSHVYWFTDSDDDDSMRTVIALHELPGSAKLETMDLSLSKLYLRLPSGANAQLPAFDSLVDLSLQCIRLEGGSRHRLGQLLSSSCCPKLQKLRLVRVTGMTELHLYSPTLRVLDMDCYNITLDVLTVIAPRLEEFICNVNWQYIGKEGQLRIGDMPCVWNLGELRLSSHGYLVEDDGFNNGPIQLLQCCSAVERLGVCLVSSFEEFYAGEEEEDEEEELVDNLMKDIPQLSHVRSLTVRANPMSEDALMTGLSCLLTRCTSTRYLHLNMDNDVLVKGTASNDQTNYLSISLPHLREIEISGLQGLKCETSLMEWLHASAPTLSKVKLTFCRTLAQRKHRKEHRNLLPRNPFAEVGRWAAASNRRNCGTFVWTPMSEER